MKDLKEIIGLFFVGIIGFGFFFTIVYFVASFGIDTEEDSIRGVLAGHCAIASALIILAIANVLGKAK